MHLCMAYGMFSKEKKIEVLLKMQLNAIFSHMLYKEAYIY